MISPQLSTTPNERNRLGCKHLNNGEQVASFSRTQSRVGNKETGENLDRKNKKPSE